jgi:phenylpropionate dioxygenase-like ring-hydroxylating dioxygenase large terminal subunit
MALMVTTDQSTGAGNATDKFGLLVRPDGRIHRRLFTDPEIFEEEMHKIFGGSWVFLIHEAEIPNLHDFKAVTLGRRPIIVTRSADGKIHALLNRCTHRGSLVCVEVEGNASRFQCPFHHWTFASDGTLLALPFPKGQGPAFDKQAHRLGRLPRVESYRGYVFGSLNPDVEPLIEYLGPARPILDWSIDKEKIGPGGLTIIKGTQHTIRGNWKLQYENVNDGYHSAFLHQSLVIMTNQRHGGGRGLDHWSSDKNNPMYDQYLGNGHKLLDQRPAVSSSWEWARPVPGREAFSAALIEKFGEQGAKEYLELSARAYINLTIYPNLFIMGHGQFAVYEPVSVDTTNVRFYTAIVKDAPEEIKRLRVRYVEDFNIVAGQDDNEAIERVQQGISLVPEMEWLNYGRGLGKEKIEDNGAITGSPVDETSIRWTYAHWKDVMSRSIRLTVL